MTRAGTLLPGLLALCLLVPASAHSATGGTTPSGGATPPSGGADLTEQRRPGRGPLLSSFSVAHPRFYDRGRAARVSFRIDGRQASVRVKLAVRRAGSTENLSVIALGERATGQTHSVRVTGREAGSALPEGALDLRISAPGLRRGAHASAVQRVEFYTHRFPLEGVFSYGGEGSRFGAGRSGHTHQGQDLTAASGTPIVAPRGGTVEHVAYQAGGAGHYVIVDGADEDRDYAFMHMLEGSVAVKQGQRVRTGQQLGQVGSTGGSSGPHLHFEIWVGGWYDGGHPIDPLPHLKRWDVYS